MDIGTERIEMPVSHYHGNEFRSGVNGTNNKKKDLQLSDYMPMYKD